MEHTILFVDDEENVLKALQRLFRREPYRLLAAGGGPEALAMIEAGENPSVIVSDQRMPGMNGTEFLSHSREVLPDAVRLLLTGHSDITAAVDAINRGGVYRYLSKPWDDQDLRLAVRDAVDRYDLVRRNRELTAELQEKNRALEEFNARLEQKVEERTRELQAAYDENLALTARLRVKVKELEGRNRIQQHLLTIHPLEETLGVLMEVVAGVMGVDGIRVFLAEAGGRFVPAAAFGAAGEDPDPAMAAPWQDLLNAALKSGVPMRTECPPGPAGGAPAGPRFLAVAPILGGEDCLGAIAVDYRHQGRAITGEELEVLKGFAMQAAIGIRDSQLKNDMPAWDASMDDVLSDME
jgi:FixJ family two-component response regulator